MASASRQQILAEISRAFAEAVLDKQALLDLVARRISEGTDGDACTVRLLSDDGTVLLPVACYHPDPDAHRALAAVMKGSNTDPREGSWSTVVGDRKVFRSTATQRFAPGTSQAQIEYSDKFGLRSVMQLPLIARDRVIGGVSLSRYRPELYTEDDEALMRDLADRAALAIDNARLFESATSELAERRRAEEALRKSEEQLRHSQKMEAVGQLAGGVAHDFNNLLTVILSYTEGIVQALPAADPLHGDAEEVLKAAQRARTLTKQLLAFSRRQVLEPRVLNLNTVVASSEKMLGRLIGEDVDLLTRPAADLHLTLVDPGQVEQVILNLVVNARDAMPRGGKITMETANVALDAEYAATHEGVRAGDHVMLAVTDTGTGMDKTTLSRIFEPFFTTKGAGKGTGLGLSMVYGIVQQSGGHIWVYSEPGQGTTFKVYFPRAADEQSAAQPAARATATRGSETILLVEDDEQVRNVVHRILRRNGYNVLVAPSAGDAILTCEQYSAPIHLLLTDVVMPQMSGPALAERLRPLRPQMRLLCMSGYTDEAVLHNGVMDSRIPFIQKPVTPDALLRKLRDVLDAP